MKKPLFTKPRKKRTKSKDWFDYHEPPFFYDSIADAKVSKRVQNNLCRGCGKELNNCHCKSSERIR